MYTYYMQAKTHTHIYTCYKQTEICIILLLLQDDNSKKNIPDSC